VPTVEERLAYLEGKIEEHSRGFGELREMVIHLDQKVDRFREELMGANAATNARIEALDQRLSGRIEALDERLSRRYTRLSNGCSRKLENHEAAVALNYFVVTLLVEAEVGKKAA
jgi:chromosome segregation ATPase